MLLFAALPTPNHSGRLLGESPRPQTHALKNLHLQREKTPFFTPFPSLSPFQKDSLLLMSLLKLFLLIHTDNSILNFHAQSSLFWGVDFFSSLLCLDTIPGAFLLLVYVYQSLSASRLHLIYKGIENSRKVKFRLVIFYRRFSYLKLNRQA